MWLSDVVHKDGQFMGNIGNDPDSVSSVAFGDEVTYAKGDISDWMYIEGNRLVGGYTILRPARENARERARRLRR